MDPFLARAMVESLSKGIDPISGRALPYSDSCSNEEIQDALLEVLAHCTIESSEQYLVRLKEEKKAERAENRRKHAQKYPRSGELWTPEEEKDLLGMHRKGFPIYKIATILKRSPEAVSYRLQRMREKPIRRTKR